MNWIKIWATVLSAAAIAGCAGTKFARPSETDLQLGRTTEQQVLAIMGKPGQEATGLANGKATKTYTYAYASFGGEPKHSGVTPVQAMSLVFHDGTLVSKAYMSNLKQDATDFDGSKAAEIQAGKTTAAQVRGLLGAAPGESIYPVVAQPKSRAMVYSYQEMRGFSLSQKMMTVVLDPNDTVADVKYENQGTWK